MTATMLHWLGLDKLDSNGWGVVVGAAGFLFGLWSFKWTRRESRLDALANFVEPMVRFMQCMNDAVTLRRTRGSIMASFPDPAAAPEAAHRANSCAKSYDQKIQGSGTHIQSAEAHFAARRARFPDRVAAELHELLKSGFALASAVNYGDFDAADLLIAKMRDELAAINKTARGWRLADPLEWTRGYVAKLKGFFYPPEATEMASDIDDLTQQDVLKITKLVQKRFTTQATNSFAVHAPQKLLDNPEIAESPKVFDDLDDSVFSVTFQDGQSEMLTLNQILFFQMSLALGMHHLKTAEKFVESAGVDAYEQINVNHNVSMRDLRRPEMAKLLLSKFKFSDVPSDG